MARKFLDISGLAQWTGPPVGMIRVEAELAAHAASDVVPVVYDAIRHGYREIKPAEREALSGFHCALDPTAITPMPERTGWRKIIPSRLPVLMALERLKDRRPALAEAVDVLERLMLRMKPADFKVGNRDGARFAYMASDRALGGLIALRPGDRLLVSAADWGRRDAPRYAADMQASGASITPICYDLIPITHQHFFSERDGRQFAMVWRELLPVCRTVITNAQSVANDIIDLATAIGAPPPSVKVLPLGSDPQAQAGPRLPPGLERGRYALFVSTIEPRKNHAMLIKIWRRLVARGWTAKHGVKLVFVGRAGWMVDDVMRDLADTDASDGTLIHLSGIDDATLARLYRDAAFCLYPSQTEGFGLPIIEAYRHGKAVISGNAGSLPEVVGGTSPMLDPNDETAWEQLIVDWFENPSARRQSEDAVAERNSDPSRTPLTWKEAAQGMLSAAGLD